MITVWHLFDVFATLFQGFVVTFISHAYLSDKRGRGYAKSGGFWFAIASAIAVTIFDCFADFELVNAFVYAAFVCVYAFASLNGSALKKVFATELSAVVILIPAALVNTLASAILGEGKSEAVLSTGLPRVLALVASLAVIGVAAFLALKLLKRSRRQWSDLSTAEWALISVILAISLVIGTLLNFLAFAPDEHKSGIYAVLVFIGLIMVNVVTCYLVIDLGKKNNAVKENEMLKLSQAYSRQYVDNANAEYDVIRKLRHDFKNNFLVISTLLEEGNYDDARELAKSHIDLLSNTEIFVDTKNDVIDAVVNAKMSEAKSFGIDCTCLSIVDVEGIDELDLCRLLSNMLENAVTACVNCNAKSKQIYLKISADAYAYTFSLKNTIDSSVLVNNPRLITTKSKRSQHGYGIEIIRDITRKYNGRCDFYEEDKMFCCTVVLKKN